MRLPLVPLAIAVVGCLGAAASAWTDRVAAEAGFTHGSHADGGDLGSRWPAGWLHSLDAAKTAARAGDPAVWTPILAYARMDTPECVELEVRLGADPVVAERMGAFVPLVVDVGLGSDAESATLAAQLDLRAAPLFVVLHSEGVVVDALEPLTGSRFEPFGFADELARAGAGADDLDELRRRWSLEPGDATARLALVDRLEARGAYVEAARMFEDGLAAEERPNGPLHRVDRLRAAIQTQWSPQPGREGAAPPPAAFPAGSASPSPSPSPPADREGAIEAQLAVEDDPAVLYRGWSFLASVFADHVERAERDPTGSYRGVPRDRWHRRLRDATRRAWRGVSEAAMVPYGALLTTRYAGETRDLDSADRMFCRAVLRSITEVAGEDSPRVQAASAAVEAIQQRR